MQETTNNKVYPAPEASTPGLFKGTELKASLAPDCQMNPQGSSSTDMSFGAQSAPKFETNK